MGGYDRTLGKGRDRKEKVGEGWERGERRYMDRGKKGEREQ